VATTATTVSSSSPSALSSPLSSIGVGSRSFRKLSGCYYECHSVVDPRSGHFGDAAMAMLPCPDCDEFFVKAESLQLHRSTRHAGKYYVLAAITFFISKKIITFLNLFKQITH
jgi:hypothetical protein